MKEFETPLTKALIAGLRTDWRNPRNTPGLLTCQNVRPVQNVLHFPGVYPQVISNLELDWPFPMIMSGPSATYIGTRYKLYKVNANNTLELSAEFLVPVDHWEMLDFQKYRVFNTGNNVTSYSPSSGWSLPSTLTFPRAKTMLNFRGQIVQGNLGTGQENWIQWSNIGDISFTITESNIAGNAVLPVEGPIHKLMYLHAGPDMSGTDRGHVVVYGEGGIVITKPFSEPTTTFSLKQSNDAYGITSWGCVNGHEDEHLFIDNRGFLHRLTVKGDEVIGYKEFLEPMLGHDPQISFDHIEEQYFIATEDACYIYNKSGLGSLQQIIYSQWQKDGRIVVIADTPLTLTIDIGTDDFDCEIRAKKLLSHLSFAIDTDGEAFASVVGRNEPKSQHFQTPWQPLNSRGGCFPYVTAIDFQVLLKVTNFTNFQLDEAFCRWKLVDKHSIRGTYGNPKATSPAY